MRSFERVLLYVVSLLFAAVLVFGDQLGSGAAAPARSPEPPPLRLDNEAPAQIGLPANAGREPVVLTDDAGRKKLEIGLGSDDRPFITLYADDGRPAIALEVTGDDTAELRMATANGRAGLSCRADGGVEFELASADRSRLNLQAEPGGNTRLAMASPEHDASVTVLTEPSGQAEVLIESAVREGAVFMSVDAEGTAGIGVKDAELAGPIMQVFPDGLAEFAIPGASGQDGPSMIRMPDGVSIIAARLPSGNPGASMITSPDGSSIIAASGESADSEQALLRVNAAGKASAGVASPTDSSGAPE